MNVTNLVLFIGGEEVAIGDGKHGEGGDGLVDHIFEGRFDELACVFVEVTWQPQTHLTKILLL